MATTFTPNCNLSKPAAADRTWDVPLNANTTLLDQMTALGSLCTTTAETPSASLNVAVSAGTFINQSNAYVLFAGGTIGVTASITNYLWLTNTGTLTTGTAWPSGGTKVVRLAVVVAGVGTIASIADGRVFLASAG